MLLANAGRKNEVSKAALRICRCSLQNLQETLTAQISRASALKQQLTQSLAEVDENRETDQLENPRCGKAEAFAERPVWCNNRETSQTAVRRSRTA
jgi:hypothetical protein